MSASPGSARGPYAVHSEATAARARAPSPPSVASRCSPTSAACHEDPTPHAPDRLGASEQGRRAAREPRAGGRPLQREETAPGERGDAPYGDSEPGRPEENPGI